MCVNQSVMYIIYIYTVYTRIVYLFTYVSTFICKVQKRISCMLYLTWCIFVCAECIRVYTISIRMDR